MDGRGSEKAVNNGMGVQGQANLQKWSKTGEIHPSGSGWEAQGGSRDVTAGEQRLSTRTSMGFN